MNSPSIWPWLGPTLVFAGAMITLWFTIRRADKREWDKWRRDTLIKLASDAVEAAREAEAKCFSTLSQKSDFVAKNQMGFVTRAASRMAVISEHLYLIGASDLADVAVRMKEVAEEIQLPTDSLRFAQRQAKTRTDNLMKQLNESGPTFFEEGGPADLEYRAKMKEIHELVQRENLAEPEEKFNALRDRLESLRGEFIVLGRRDLELPTSWNPFRRRQHLSAARGQR